MRKPFTVLAILAAMALMISANVGQTFAGAGQGNPLAATAGHAVTDSGLGNLRYHSGGSVQTGTHHTYAVYWGSSFSANYKTIINAYFGNVAADSGKTSNVYYSDTQYYQRIGGITTHV